MDIRPFWNEKEKMNENVEKMFRKAYKALPEMDTADRLIAAQKMTDIALNCFTPVGSEKAFEKYRNKIIQHSHRRRNTAYADNYFELVFCAIVATYHSRIFTIVSQYVACLMCPRKIIRCVRDIPRGIFK